MTTEVKIGSLQKINYFEIEHWVSTTTYAYIFVNLLIRIKLIRKTKSIPEVKFG